MTITREEELQNAYDNDYSVKECYEIARMKQAKTKEEELKEEIEKGKNNQDN